jgi:signal peptidase I
MPPRHEPNEHPSAFVATPHAAAPAPRQNAGRSLLGEVFVFSALALAIVIPIRLLIAQPFVVKGASMLPSFKSGDYLIVDEISYRFAPPMRGDVIVFRDVNGPPAGLATLFFSKHYLIKRVVGLPSETVEVRGSAVVIRNAERPEGFTLAETYAAEPGGTTDLSVTLGPAEYFVLGDNRAHSFDSRSWGPLPRENIVGRALLRLWPVRSFALWPGWAAESDARTEE